MRILVTGAGGQLAQSLIERSGGPSGTELAALGRAELDLERPETIASALDRARPDLVINSGAYTGVDSAEDEPERAFSVNAIGAGEVARRAAELGVPIIQLSTDYVFDGAKGAAYIESDRSNPLNVYGRSKLEGEERVRAANPHHVIVRTAWLYSPFGRNFVKTMLNLASERDEVAVVEDQLGSPTSALDFADALLALAREISEGRSDLFGRTFHVAGKGTASWFDLARQVFEVSAAVGGPHARVRPIRTGEFPVKAVRPANSALDSGLFERELGFATPEWRTAVAAVARRLVN